MKVNAVIAFMRVRIYKTTIILYFSGNCRSRSFQFACYDNERCDIEKEAPKREFAKVIASLQEQL